MWTYEVESAGSLQRIGVDSAKDPGTYSSTRLTRSLTPDLKYLPVGPGLLDCWTWKGHPPWSLPAPETIEAQYNVDGLCPHDDNGIPARPDDHGHHTVRVQPPVTLAGSHG
jgi:hypothetical protein